MSEIYPYMFSTNIFSNVFVSDWLNAKIQNPSVYSNMLFQLIQANLVVFSTVGNVALYPNPNPNLIPDSFLINSV